MRFFCSYSCIAVRVSRYALVYWEHGPEYESLVHIFHKVEFAYISRAANVEVHELGQIRKICVLSWNMWIFPFLNNKTT